MRARARVYLFAILGGYENITPRILAEIHRRFWDPYWFQLQSGFDEIYKIYCQSVDTEHILDGFTSSHIDRQTSNSHAADVIFSHVVNKWLLTEHLSYLRDLQCGPQ